MTRLFLSHPPLVVRSDMRDTCTLVHCMHAASYHAPKANSQHVKLANLWPPPLVGAWMSCAHADKHTSHSESRWYMHVPWMAAGPLRQSLNDSCLACLNNKSCYQFTKKLLSIVNIQHASCNSFKLQGNLLLPVDLVSDVTPQVFGLQLSPLAWSALWWRFAWCLQQMLQ